MWKTSSALLLVVAVLLMVGGVMVASTSTVKGLEDHGDTDYFLKRQLVWIVLSVVAGIAACFFDYHYLRHLAFPLLAVSCLLLVLVFVPHVGVRVGGSYRWLRLGGLGFQPSELAKFSLVVAICWWFTRERRKVRELARGFLYPAAAIVCVLVLILAEPDYGTTVLTAAVSLLIMFVAGVRIHYLVLLAVAGALFITVLVAHNPNRMERLMAFLEPEKYAQTTAYQLKGALDAFVLGGRRGVGLGQGVQKQSYLPESHTDFIYAVVGEELGLRATVPVLLLYLAFFALGMRIAMKTTDVFGRFLAFGLTLMITLQAIINFGVVTGLFPTKGLSLPFISFGGSCLLVSMIAVGVLVNIAQHAGGLIEEPAIRDTLHDL